MDPRGSCTIDPDAFGRVLEMKQPCKLTCVDCALGWARKPVNHQASSGSGRSQLPTIFVFIRGEGEGDPLCDLPFSIDHRVPSLLSRILSHYSTLVTRPRFDFASMLRFFSQYSDLIGVFFQQDGAPFFHSW